MRKATMNRREFLRLSLVATAGGVIAACTTPEAGPTTAAPAAEVKATEMPATEAPAAEATAPPAEQPTAVPPSTYSEAPMLAEKVAAGELPPVDERLPVEPIMVDPLGQVGTYGGSIGSIVPDPTAESPECDWLRGTALAMRGPDLKEIIPWVAKGWDLSPDLTEITIHMREGLRWSDGMPLTTEDVKFWYEDIFLNTDLTPQIAVKWAPGGEPMKVIVDDDYTFRIQFAVPNPIIIDNLPSLNPWAPKHFLAQYHINHNEDANQIAEDEGFEFWYECFEYHNEVGQLQQDPEQPSLERWIYEQQDTMGNRFYVRNPYYWVVDTKGQQLPYVDHVERMAVENLEVLNAKVLAGEGTHHSWFLTLENYPLYKQNEEQGNYTVGLYPDLRASEYGFAFNYTHKDPVLREIFNDIRWRKAISHSINRDEINELRFAGLGKPRQPIMDPSCSFWEEGLDEYYIEYDVDLANELLDDMGLEWDANKQWRLRPDGEKLLLSFEFWSGKANIPEITELMKGYWAKLGIDVALKPEDQQYYQQRMQANEHTIGVWAIGGSSEVYSRQNEPIRYRPPWHWPAASPLGGTGWYQWLTTDGEEGLEPPDEIKELWEVVAEWLQEPYGTARYKELGKQMLRINAENLWLIGTVGLVPRAAIVKNTVRNAPQPGQTLSVEYGMWNYYQPEQWWIEE